MAKDTSEIVKELGLSQDFQTFYNENKEHMVFADLTELLKELLRCKGLKKSQVIKNAELSEVYGYQIFTAAEGRMEAGNIVRQVDGLNTRPAEGFFPNIGHRLGQVYGFQSSTVFKNRLP